LVEEMGRLGIGFPFESFLVESTESCLAENTVVME
jgi:hypothetical protein